MKWRTLITAISLLVLTFYSGYRLGVYRAVDIETALTDDPFKQDSAISKSADNINHAWQGLDLARVPEQLSMDAINARSLESAEPSDDMLDAPKEPYQWRDANDIVGMLNELMALSEPGNNQDIDAFAKAMDQLRRALADSPTQLAILVEHMQTLDFDARAFHYITAILQGLPDEKGYAAMQNAALQLSQRSDDKSRQQFLHLVSNTYNAADNPEILRTLVEIALYSDQRTYVKLDALDLVMPFQITGVERTQILNGLNGMLESADQAEQGALVNHILRFSNAEERARMATNFINAENDIELRYSVFDGIHSGTVPTSPMLKEQLFSIAKNPQDPLHEQAKHALMYVFDISNQEYQQLKE